MLLCVEWGTCRSPTPPLLVSSTLRSTWMQHKSSNCHNEYVFDKCDSMTDNEFAAMLQCHGDR